MGCCSEVRAEDLARGVGEVVAIGMRNIQNADYSGISNTLDYYAELIASTRTVTDAPIVLGGSGFSVMPASWPSGSGPTMGFREKRSSRSQRCSRLSSPARASNGLGISTGSATGSWLPIRRLRASST